MKILCFTDSLVSGGAQRQLVNLAILLKKRGHTVDFLVYRDIPFFKRYLDDAEIPVHLPECRNNIDRVRKIARFFREYRADIVISFLETPNFISCVSSVGKHSWVLITNELSAKESSFRGMKNKLFKWFERFSDRTVCNSQNAKEMWIKHYPCRKDKLSVIYNPVLIPDDVVPAERPTGKVQIVVPASYQCLKNPVRVVEAVHLLSEEEKGKLHIDWFGRTEPSVGETEPYREASALVKRYGLQNVIRLNGETDAIYSHVKACDGIGLFSTVEGLPNAICEGMMLKKPVIMSRVSDYPVLTGKGNGITCDPLDVESIRTALSAFLALSDERRAQMGQASFEIADSLFRPDVVTEAWEKLIRSLKKT